MKNSWLGIALITIVMASGCKSSSSDKDIAKDMCGCFNMIKDSFPAAALSVFEKTALANEPKEAYQKELQKLSPEDGQKVISVLMSTSKAGSPVGNCLNEIDKKYKGKEKDEQGMTKRMVEALKTEKGCDIMLALMRMNLK